MMMAATSGMQSICGSPESIKRTGPNQFLVPSSYVLPQKRNASFRVRSMAEEGEKPEVAATTPPPRTPTPTPTPPPKPKAKTSFSDVLAFSGPGPERINGRLAMIGFVAAMGVELSKGQDLFSQVENGGLTWFLGTTAVLTLASLVPLFKGVSAESQSVNPMTSDAELWNGRFAMIGLIALAFTEYVKGGAFFI